ncbi:MAG: CDP-archaeol synthase [Pseudomonadota bacterium]
MTFADALLTALYLQIPVVIGGVLHMWVVTRGHWATLATPVCTAWFGTNKTWRGFVVVPLATAAGALCLLPVERILDPAPFTGHLPAWPPALALLLAGLAGGLGYVLAELPNSYLKRRLGIAPGATPTRHRRLFIALDQLDSGIGVALVWLLFPGFSPLVCLLYALTFPLTALGVKRLLFLARLKKSAV